jgi:hypothetical protein
MEGKILKGAARGGLVELTKMKEQQLKRREEELQRRYAQCNTNTAHHSAAAAPHQDRTFVLNSLSLQPMALSTLDFVFATAW